MKLNVTDDCDAILDLHEKTDTAMLLLDLRDFSLPHDAPTPLCSMPYTTTKRQLRCCFWPSAFPTPAAGNNFKPKQKSSKGLSQLIIWCFLDLHVTVNN